MGGIYIPIYYRGFEMFGLEDFIKFFWHMVLLGAGLLVISFVGEMLGGLFWF